MNLKEPLTFEEQLQKLKDHGIGVSDEHKAVQVLKEINYYRLTGYALQFRVDPKNSNYTKGTTFDSVHHIYLADERLRDLFRMYLEKVEIYFRTQISYGFSMKKCTVSPYDQHYDKNNFYNETGCQEVLDNFKRETNYYKDSLIVKHHKTKYANKMPLWVMIELMSFSNLSKLYSSMYYSEKDAIAKFTSSFLRAHSEIQNNSLFAYVLILLKRLPYQKSKHDFVYAVQTVIEEYKDDIEMTLIGFPTNCFVIIIDQTPDIKYNYS